MKKYKWYIILFNLIALLVFLNYSVVKKEKLLKCGDLIFLKLAPVDPRSLMQGDYMILSYELARIEDSKIPAKRGHAVLAVDKKGIARKITFPNEERPLRDNEYRIRYNATNSWEINLGAESYFFQEGNAKKYDSTQYGGLKIDRDGNSLLYGLYDKNLRKLE